MGTCCICKYVVTVMNPVLITVRMCSTFDCRLCQPAWPQPPYSVTAHERPANAMQRVAPSITRTPFGPRGPGMRACLSTFCTCASSATSSRSPRGRSTCGGGNGALRRQHRPAGSTGASSWHQPEIAGALFGSARGALFDLAGLVVLMPGSRVYIRHISSEASARLRS